MTTNKNPSDIRRWKTYKDLAKQLEWLESKEATPIKILKKLYPIDKINYLQAKALQVLIDDYNANGTTTKT